ncbi:hypothetical protein DPMN_005478 [Dreissena polymorpha]|uniref:Uncharacterized protein n=1 Tax=Dreissena polymorpha TaxID=45954 RepID=A0A9D4RWV7_DREPO|nr:hypothetical protein DPMN_005478 [Dreissena polymorpha]
MKRFDFVSDWLYLSIQKGKDLLTVPHGLGQAPVLVQVQATPPDGPNKDFFFNGMGGYERLSNVARNSS